MRPSSSSSSLLQPLYLPPTTHLCSTKSKSNPSHVTVFCAKTKTQSSPDDYHTTPLSEPSTPKAASQENPLASNELVFVPEIGPGTGSLTNALVEAGAMVLAIEKAPYMAALVKESFEGTDKLKVVQKEFVKCHLRSHMSSLFENMSLPNAKPRLAKVVTNIPFNISTDVVKQLLPMGEIFSEVVLLLQVSITI